MRLVSRILWSLSATLVLALLATRPTLAATDVTLVFQGAVKGQIEDCGCRKNPLGGLAARKVILDAIRAEHPNVVLVDAGNMMGAPTDPGRLQSEFLVAETAGLGYAVAGLGSNDLRYGTSFLQQVQREKGLQFTSANLYAEGKPLFAPYEVIEVQDVRIGVISVHDAQMDLSLLGEKAGVELRDPAASLGEWLPKLKAESDVVVLLSHLRPADLPVVLGALDATLGIDFVIDGVGQTHLANTKKVGQSTYVSANDQGKYLGQLDFTVADDGAVANVAYTLHEVKPQPQDANVAERVAAFKQQLETLANASTPNSTVHQ